MRGAPDAPSVIAVGFSVTASAHVAVTGASGAYSDDEILRYVAMMPQKNRYGPVPSLKSFVPSLKYVPLVNSADDDAP